MRSHLVLWLSLLASIALLSGCGDDDDDRRPVRTRPLEPAFIPIAGGVGWIADTPLVYRRPSNAMRAAEYIVQGHDDAVLAVSYFPPAQGGGGDVQQNVGRWVGQLQRAEGDRPIIEERTINDLQVTTVDVRGTFVGRRGTGNNNPPQVNWRLLGAIVEAEEGLVFFKLTGSEPALESAHEAFFALVDSIHPE